MKENQKNVNIGYEKHECYGQKIFRNKKKSIDEL